MDEAMLKSGQFPNVAIMAGTDPKEVMQEYANDDSHDALKEQINRFNASKSEEIAENGTSKGDINNFDVQNDTREKLEADIRAWHRDTPFATKPSVQTLLGWLDRQKEITRRECADERENLLTEAIATCTKKISKLEAERDALKEQINRFNASKSEEIAENDTSKGDINNIDVQNDTREKLNEELMDSCLTFANGGGHLRAFAYVSDLLDRQDAITRRECERLDFKAITAVANIMNAELTAERDQLSRDLDAEHALVVQFEHDNEELKADLKTANDTINTLRASVAGLKETVEKLGAQ